MDIDYSKELQNPDLKTTVNPNNKLKELFVNYVGNKTNPKDGNVTIEMIIDALAEEFPEFLMSVAEENFIRGYEQAISDIESETQEK